MKIGHIIMGAAVCLAAISCKSDRPGFAIVIDPRSYDEAKAEIDEYQQLVASRGLDPVLVIDHWQNPDSIRFALMDLHEKRHIEGCVLIGDIPVVMVRDAQHLTTALKMDQYNPSFSRNE
ncbi:MAG: hypothetical protein MJY66_09060, partial [Bacteroidaceae bacterium]|nr:hypothetical protein [Bacteroidaceae bacterium]